MERIEADEQAALLWQLPAVNILNRVWIQQFWVIDGQIIWRTESQGELPPSTQMISSPYDLEARLSGKHANT